MNKKIGYLIYALLAFQNINAFKSKPILPILGVDQNLYLNSASMIDYLVSLKEYTIITDTDKYKHLQEKMIDCGLNVYYVNLNNVYDKNEIIKLLKLKFNNFDSSENIWFFHKGFLFGSSDDIYKIIEKKKSL